LRINVLSRLLVVIAAAALLASGCAGYLPDQPAPQDKSGIGTSEGEDISTPSKQEPAPGATPDRIERLEQSPPAGLEKVEITPPDQVTGEVPADILDQIIADLLKRTHAERDDIQVLRAEAVVWNDGALGCPQPGEFYIQVLINGYWVVYEVEGIAYDYRVSDNGSFKLCEGENMAPLNQPDPENLNPLVLEAMEDLAERLGRSMDEIDLLSFEEVVWPDASMGCPLPGMRYKQVPYDGALIRLVAEEQIYNYHSGGSRGVFLCELTININKDAPQIDIVPPPGSEDE
jgi:hypothetical protein